MDREKVLAFLNLTTNKIISKNGKYIIKIGVAIEVFFSLLIVGCGFLYQCFALSIWNTALISLFVISDIILFIRYKHVYKPTCEITESMLNAFITSIKLFCGYSILSKREYIFFGYDTFNWFHLTVLVVSLLLGLYVIVKFIKAYNALKNNSLDDAKRRIRNDNKVHPYVIAIGCVAATFLIILLRDTFGVGFYLWALGCIWLWVTLLFLPKFIVLKKYGVENWFEAD